MLMVCRARRAYNKWPAMIPSVKYQEYGVVSFRPLYVKRFQSIKNHIYLLSFSVKVPLI
ncbi:hypothetical protein MANES_16G012302v8 [Manihot esculenta]|uniref:Uncharacterized protein n=1 Tax=Manihot esculenta TaxID=3983 RepID=A0ACB7G664_MANES|nr:hypothetical protein MANES_16G012302v8 [Manihot esculenta]